MGVNDGLEATKQRLEESLALLKRINKASSERIISLSECPELIAQAYRALEPGGNTLNGRDALRLALRSEGIDQETVIEIDARYIECAVNWHAPTG